MTKWWSNRSDPERFDLYTRWSLYLLFAVVPLGALSLAGDSGASRGTILAIILISVLQVGASIALLSKGITHYLGGPPPPAPLLVVVANLSLAGAAVSLTAPGVSFVGDTGSGVWLPYLFIFVGVAAVTPKLTSKQLLLVSAALVVVVAGLAWWLGAGPARVIGAAIGIGISSVSVTLAFRISVWMLKAFWQIDRSRTVESALAVAEERLRFSRDLHDVLGRNLSVIAVKSELASELVRRSRPEAATEIAEVNRIAQESLREVRAVVRGYREADLATEIAGARGILGAAGIDCGVDGDASCVPAEIQNALGWVVRESTTNVLRHSQARTCTITIGVEAGGAVLTVDNDGVRASAISAAAASAAIGGPDARGSGLAGLRERLVALNGTLDAGPTTPERFRVSARIPLQRSDDATSDPAGADVAGPDGLAALERE